MQDETIRELRTKLYENDAYAEKLGKRLAEMLDLPNISDDANPLYHTEDVAESPITLARMIGELILD